MCRRDWVGVHVLQTLPTVQQAESTAPKEHWMDHIVALRLLCLPHSYCIHWHALDRKQGEETGERQECFNHCQCSLNGVHLSPAARPLGWGFSWNYQKERFTFDRTKEKETPIHFHTEGWQSRVPFKWQLNPCGCLLFGETTFHQTVLITKASLISESVTVCVFVCVCLCVCMRMFNHLNLHDDDLPVSQAPARIRGGGGERRGLSRLVSQVWGWGVGIKMASTSSRMYWKELEFQRSFSSIYLWSPHQVQLPRWDRGNHGNACQRWCACASVSDGKEHSKTKTHWRNTSETSIQT